LSFEGAFFLGGKDKMKLIFTQQKGRQTFAPAAEKN